jgi:pyruvate dehydrogenase E1 component beta subunit
VPKLDDYVLPIGKARVAREGKDVTLVSYSIGVGVALDAASQLAEQGIEAEVIDLRRSARSTRRRCSARSPRPTAWSASRKAGRSAPSPPRSRRSRWRKAFDDLDAPVLRVTNVDVPLPYAANLEKLALIKVSDVVEAAKKVCYRS